MASEVPDSAQMLFNAPVWNADADEDLVCIAVNAETHDVKSFTFAAAQPRRFAFQAGQYFLFECAVNGEVESRCYSISSSPCASHAFSITVKRVPGGTVSNWLHDTLRVGARLKASGPRGTFVRPASRKLLLLSAGSGITPVMAMLREIADRHLDADICFVHAARSPRDMIFRAELAQLAHRLPGLRLLLLPEERGDEPHWPGPTGRICEAYLRLVVPDMAERTIMCCGPAPFMAAARAISADLGVPQAQYFEESFDAAPLDEAAQRDEAAPLDEATPLDETSPAHRQMRSFAVTFARQGRKIEVAENQTILASARSSGIKLPSSCSNGLCGTCKSKLLSGKVDMAHNGGIRQREVDAGLFLPCCSKPLSDLVIDR